MEGRKNCGKLGIHNTDILRFKTLSRIITGVCDIHITVPITVNKILTKKNGRTKAPFASFFASSLLNILLSDAVDF